MKRRNFTTFTLSFIDVITCGLGAIILLFVIVNARNAVQKDTLTSQLRGEVARLEQEILEAKQDLVETRNTLESTTTQLVTTQGRSRQVIKVIDAQTRELATSVKDTLASQAQVAQLIANVKSLEEEVKRLEAGSTSGQDAGTKLRRFPGQGHRQYVTDLKMNGKRIFILVDASASMLDDTIVGIIRRRNLPEQEQRQATKWQQSVKTVDWLTTQLPVTSQVQVYTFHETAQPVLEETRGKWLQARQADSLDKTVAQLKQMVPERGTSLINAFAALREMQPLPDNIFLLTDSLPTMGENPPKARKVSGKRRLRLFNQAIRQLPDGVPINIILYPMEGDPIAAWAFWRLAVKTRGSFLSPSKDWP